MRKLVFCDGRELDVPDFETSKTDVPAAFVISIRKSGSTMVTYATQLIARAAGLGFLDVGSLLFYGNVPAKALHADPCINTLLTPGVLYSGFRDYPRVMEQSDLFRSAQKVLFVRDPRDALVSEYFSNAYSHDIPAKEGPASTNADLMSRLRQEALRVGVDEYVLQRAQDFVSTATAFFPAVGRPEVQLLRYEDLIFDKPLLIAKLASHLRIMLEKPVITQIAAQIDIRPGVENPHAFVRRVTPGDHLEKLQASTVRELNERLRPVISRFGYSEG